MLAAEDGGRAACGAGAWRARAPPRRLRASSSGRRTPTRCARSTRPRRRSRGGAPRARRAPHRRSTAPTRRLVKRLYGAGFQV